MPRKNQHINHKSPSLLKMTLALTFFAPALALSREHAAPKNSVSACEKYFSSNTYVGLEQPVPTVFISENHQINEEQVADCLASMATEGDHLLLESPNTGAEIKCDPQGDSDPYYSQFNGKLKCYGWDLDMTDPDNKKFIEIDNRWYLYRTLSQIISVMNKKNSGTEAIQFLKKAAKESFDAAKKIGKGDPANRKRQSALHTYTGKHLKKIADNLRGLERNEIIRRLTSDIDKAVKDLRKQVSFYRAARDESLLKNVKAHQAQLAGSQSRLYVIAGGSHVDPKNNQALKTEIDAMEARSKLNQYTGVSDCKTKENHDEKMAGRAEPSSESPVPKNDVSDREKCAHVELDQPVPTVFIDKLNGSKKQYVEDCLATMAAEGDHVLLESPNTGAEIKCDFQGKLGSSYAQFNGKLKCYGWDLDMTDPGNAELLKFDCRSNLYRVLHAVVTDIKNSEIKSGTEAIQFLKNIAESLDQAKEIGNMDPAKHKHQSTRNKYTAQHLKKIANNLRGLERDEIIRRLSSDLGYTASDLRKQLPSFDAARNKALLQNVKLHQAQLAGSKHRLFVHVDLEHNQALKAEIDFIKTKSKLNEAAVSNCQTENEDRTMTILQSIFY